MTSRLARLGLAIASVAEDGCGLAEAEYDRALAKPEFPETRRWCLAFS
jgi:hypothetical protein